MEFDVQDEHEAYICVSKPRPQDSKEKHGYIRLILASSPEEGVFQLEGTGRDTQFSDCFIHMKDLKAGRHVLMVEA